jgi:hypothetical protein
MTSVKKIPSLLTTTKKVTKEFLNKNPPTQNVVIGYLRKLKFVGQSEHVKVK